MQSMIKRKVDISLNAHVDMMLQVVLDAYTLNQERFIQKGHRSTAVCSGNMVYYRMLRQTGHTAALKKLLSYDFQTENDVYVFGMFHTGAELKNLFCKTRDINTGREFVTPDIDKKANTATMSNWLGTDIYKANIIVFSDSLHDPKRIEAGHKFIAENFSALSNLSLVVFLG